jgi:thiol-disulfide isomerase/thioredoxin
MQSIDIGRGMLGLLVCAALWRCTPATAIADDSKPDSAQPTARKALGADATDGAPLESAAAPTGGLREGWKWMVTIPEVQGRVQAREARVKLWVEKGWLVVRRITAEEDLEWQIVLARASDPRRPEIKVHEAGGGLEIAYRGYLIRESRLAVLRQLRMFRERKTEQSPEWPIYEFENQHLNGNRVSSDTLNGWVGDFWWWVQSGPSKTRPDLWLRFEPHDWRRFSPQRDASGIGMLTLPGGASEIFSGHNKVIDDGDLFFATRTTLEEAERGFGDKTVKRLLEADNAPPVEFERGLNVDKPPAFDQLKGKVVLLAFWASWCQPAVERLARAEALHERFSERGLVAIGVHPPDGAENAAALAKAAGVAFPVVMDAGQPNGRTALSGETAKRYKVTVLPSFFLIDKSGKLHWGYGMGPPSESQIEQLLK